MCVDPYEGHGNPKENFNIVLKMIQDRDIKNMEIKKMGLKKFPSFWLGAINKTNFFNNFIYKYHVPFKLRLSYSFIKNL